MDLVFGVYEPEIMEDQGTDGHQLSAANPRLVRRVLCDGEWWCVAVCAVVSAERAAAGGSRGVWPGRCRGTTGPRCGTWPPPPPQPPRRPRALGVRRDHLGGSWDQLDTPRPPQPHLRASWDHLGPTWGDVPSGEAPRGVDALLTHTLRPSRHEAGTPARTAPSRDVVDEGVGEVVSPRDSVAGAKGLLNAPGQNNCFLNSAVQPIPAHLSPSQSILVDPSPPQSIPVHPGPSQPIPAHLSPSQSILVDPSPPQSIPVHPGPSQPIPAHPSPSQSILVDPSPSQPIQAHPTPSQSIPAHPNPSPVHPRLHEQDVSSIFR
ncbi:protein piccolo-like [Scylla paramamosain]|uniref:protein piccolo-like n=1 Tax=Scylla paramamosain TaxID=85552 RepID=UPI003083CBDA